MTRHAIYTARPGYAPRPPADPLIGSIRDHAYVWTESRQCGSCGQPFAHHVHCLPGQHAYLRGPLKGCACGAFSDDDPTGYHAKDSEQFYVELGGTMHVGRHVRGARNLVRYLKDQATFDPIVRLHSLLP